MFYANKKTGNHYIKKILSDVISLQLVLSGLCGNADYNKKNDWDNSQGKYCGGLPKNRKHWCVGNSWRVGGPRAHKLER